MSKRLISFILVLAMCLSWVPVAAFSAENETGETVAADTAQTTTQADIAVQSQPAEEFTFVEPGRENDAPVGDIIITDTAYRIQMNPDGNSYTILEYLGSAANVVIPSAYNGLPITRIGAYAFQGKTRMTSVSIPESVTRIEEGVFDGCTRLTYHTYENGRYLGSPENPYYYYCSPADQSLTQATMHEDTKLVAAYAFRGCDSLQSVVVPDGVIQVGYGMLFGCDVHSVTVPFVGELGTDKNPQFGWIFGARSMGGNISYVPQSLKTVVITGGNSIAQGAFYGVDMLEAITLPYLGGSADSTENVFISYYWGADTYETNILPISVKAVTVLGGNIGQYGFSGCTAVESVTLGDGVETIGSNAFSKCTGLSSVTLSGSLKTIGSAAFADCAALTRVNISDLGAWCAVSLADLQANPLYYARSLYVNGEIVTHLTVPDGVEIINRYAFYNCGSLVSITLPQSLTEIGSRAFNSCAGLQSISFPAGLSKVGYEAFKGCTALNKVNIQSISGWCAIDFPDWNANPLSIAGKLYVNGQKVHRLVIPEGVTKIGAYAFYNCSSLTEVVLPQSLTVIKASAFYKCNGLTSITLPANLTSIESEAFWYCDNLSRVINNSALTVKADSNNGYVGANAKMIVDSAGNTTYPYSSMAFEYIATEDGFCFEKRYGKYYLVAYNGTESSVQLPADINGESYNISSVRGVQELIIPEGYTSVWGQMFYEQTELESIVIPDTVTSIGWSAFKGCTSLKSIFIPASVKNIDSSAFEGCTSLESVVIGDGVTGIASYAFAGCSALKSVTLPKSLTYIDYWVFSNCTSLESISLPDGMTFISGSAFRGCSSLRSITLPDALSSIGDNVFNGCTALAELNIPASVQWLGSDAFAGCTGLEKLFISDVGAWCSIDMSNGNANPLAFAKKLYVNDSHVTQLEIPEGTEQINAYVFHVGNALTKISIPKTVAQIETNAFTESLAVELDAHNTAFQIVDGILYDKPATQVLFVFDNIPENVVMPAGVTQIADSLFRDRTQLQSITLPAGLTTIGNYAFYGCSNLKQINLPDTLTSIGWRAFYSCIRLESITIPDGVTAIGESAFEQCTGLVRAVLPNGLTVLEDYVFSDCGLESVELPSQLEVIGTGAFRRCHALTDITLPQTVTTIEGSAFEYCGLTAVELPKGLTSLGSSAFSGTPLRQVTMPDTLTAIGSNAFSYCKYLTQVTLPQQLTSLGSSAFYGCSNLISIKIPDGVTVIEGSTFSSCESLKSVDFPAGLTSIGSSAFQRCSSLETLTFPQNLTTIGNSAFSSCYGLSRIVFNNGLLTLGSSAFESCSSLVELVLPRSLTTIGTSAFRNCYYLTSVTLPQSLTSIGSSAFYGCSTLYRVINNSALTLQLKSSSQGYAAYYAKMLIDSAGSVTYAQPTWSFAYIDTADGFRFMREKGVYTLIGYVGAEPTAVLPLSVEGQSFTTAALTGIRHLIIPEGVTAVTQYMIRGCDTMTGVTLPKSLKTIGDYAFNSCGSLKSLVIPEGVTTIGYCAFAYCSALESVSIPSSATNFGGSEFQFCSSLKSVVIPQGVTVLSGTFDGCSSLSEVVVPESVTQIGWFSFRNCSLTSVVLPDGVNTIGDYAFYGCTSLESIQIPDGVPSVGNYCFYGCTNLKSITIPESVTELGSYAFYDCKSLESLVIPEGVTCIKDHTFTNCQGLKDISLLGIITEYGADAFRNCDALTQLELTGVRQIGSGAFADCAELTVLSYAGEQDAWRHVMKATDWNANSLGITVECLPDTGLFYETDTAFESFYISGFDGIQEAVTVDMLYSGRPVVAVLSNAFGGNEEILSVSLPDTVTYLGENAFANCGALESISLPAGLVTMQRGVLAGCDSLESLTLPFVGSGRSLDDTSYLGYIFGAYSYKENESYMPRGLTDVTVTDVQGIGDYAFYGCSGLESITICDQVLSLGSYAFSGCLDLETVNLPGDLSDMGAYAFEGCMSLRSLVLPEGLESLGDGVFQGCSALTELVLPDAVRSVGQKLLSGCNNLTQITIGTGLRYDSIGDLSHENPLFGLDKSSSRLKTYMVAEENPDFTVTDGVLCRKLAIDGGFVEVEIVDAPAQANLRKYEMPELIVKIGAYAFAYNNTLRGIDLEYVRMIGRNAFYKAENLIYANFGTATQTLPEGVEGISYSQYVGDEAFMGCSSLQSVNLDSEMLIGIGNSAFADCNALTTVTLGKNIRTMGLGAFGTSGSGGSVLEAITVHPDNTYLESIDGVLYQQGSDGLTLLIYPAMSQAYTVEDGKNVFRIPSDSVIAIESYAFQMAQDLDVLYVQPQQEMRIGNYAFAGSKLEHIHIGENVVSLGLRRGEGEYTVFSQCNYLVAIEVDSDNPYYTSRDGVLFDKKAVKLIKYPRAKTGNVYEVPGTVQTIASMAFRDSTQLKYVRIQSPVDTVGMEAFYGCTDLAMIFFDRVYAPTSILENAFTTFDSVNEDHMANPRTQIGYSQGYYLDGAGGQYGWSNYQDVYDIALCRALPDTEVNTGNDFYAVVVVDSEGRRINGIHVTLTDPNGNTETVATGQEGAETGVAMFYDLFGSVGLGFTLNFDGNYSLKVTDPEGVYFTYANPVFCLDEDMRITYVTLTTLPSIYGTTCGETDINTESAQINKAEYGYSQVTLINESLGYVEGNVTSTPQSETVDISVVAYTDSKAGWSFVSKTGALLDPNGGLFQNGVSVGGKPTVQVQDDSVLFTFRVDVSKLVPEVPVEARLTAYDTLGNCHTCVSVLNIHVFDFIVTEDDVDLDAQELEIDLKKQNATLAKLFGSSSIDVSLGKNLSFGVAVDGSTVEMTLGGSYEKSANKGSAGVYSSYEEGYEKNHGAHNKNTYFFQFQGIYIDKYGKSHLLTYNVRFARGTEKSNYFYYRCYVYEGAYKNEVAKFYGAVNGLNDMLAKTVGAKTYRQRVAPKAYMIYMTHLASANHSADKVSGINELEDSAQYIEAVQGSASVSNSHSFDVELTGKLVFEYDRQTGLKPVSSEIHGELYYTFKHNSQFVVWVIPVVLEVQVKVGGEVDITLKYDENRTVSFDEAKLTLSASISANVGVGCSVASVGVYGSIGTVFILDFYPEFGVESWTLNGEIGAYMKILWYTKKFQIAKFSNVQLMNDTQVQAQDTISQMYLAENYSSEDLATGDGTARIIAVGTDIYKIFYADTSKQTGYDTYNCRKLAIAKWSGSDWGSAVLVDDNGLNDANYDVYSADGQTYIVYTQQSTRLDEASADDTYASAANMTVKTACITDPEKITAACVAEGEYYKYFATVTQVGDNLTAVWAENTDNNMFGVNPYNYIDANGTSHVFETTANAVYTSQFVDGQWQSPVCVASGLSAVTDISVATDGSICYIVDQNGDLGDSADRVMYCVGQNVTAVNDIAKGSITGVEAYKDSHIYYFAAADDTAASGLYTYSLAGEVTAELPHIANMADNYRIVRDPDGTAVAVFYTAIKTWEEGGNTVDGSAMYAVFSNAGQWSLPVEISAFPAESDVYISFFDVVYQSDDSVMLSAEFVNRDGLLLYRLTEPNYILASKLEVTSYDVDYVNRQLNVTLSNTGARNAQVFIAVDGGQRVSYGEAVASGDTVVISIPLDDCRTLTPVVQIFDSPSGEAIKTVNDIDLNYADVVPFAKQLLLGEDNSLLLAVKNTGNVANGGYLFVRAGNYDAQTFGVEELLANVDTDVLTTTTAVFAADAQGTPFWVVKLEAAAGDLQYFEIPLTDTAFIEGEGLLTVYASVEPALEKGGAADNNITYVSYQALTGVLAEGEIVSEEVELDSNRVDFDVKTEESVSVGFSCGLENTVQSVALNGVQLTASEDFTVESQEGRGILTLLRSALEDKGAGVYTLAITFAEGQIRTATVTIPRYYTVTWISDGALLCTTQVKHGDIPYIASIPVRDSSQNTAYAFIGWSTDPNGVTVGTKAITSDTTYYAVWGEEARVYTVTWSFLDKNGKQLQVKEKYEYNAMPAYTGTIAVPAGTEFVGWDQELQPVTQDVSYTAQYGTIILYENGQKKHTYLTLEDALQTYDPACQYIRLMGDATANVSLNADLYIDLRGYCLDGTIQTNGFTVYGMDSTTDSYTSQKMGYFTCVDENGNAIVPERHFKSDITGSIKRYMAISTETGYTFHRFYLGITHMSLKPSVTGVGYKAVFAGDDMVISQLDENNAFGFSLQLDGYAPVCAYKDRDSFVSGKKVTMRLDSFDVESFGETQLGASAMLKLVDGTVIESSQVSMTIRRMLETIDANYLSYSETQLDAVKEMVEKFAVIKQWGLDNLC